MKTKNKNNKKREKKVEVRMCVLYLTLMYLNFPQTTGMSLYIYHDLGKMYLICFNSL